MRVFALVAEFNLLIDHLDVTTVSLNGKLEEEGAYMKQPKKSFETGKEDRVHIEES